jgi:hypothetical protein
MRICLIYNLKDVKQIIFECKIIKFENLFINYKKLNYFIKLKLFYKL